jgi:ATP-dependent DNA helicase RecQ
VQLLKDCLLDWQQQCADGEVLNLQTLEFLYEALSEQKRDMRLGKGVFLTTAHSVKGLEFGHVFIIDGGWNKDETESRRRLLYVAMTRAKETLCLMQQEDMENPYLEELRGDYCWQREVEPQDMKELDKKSYIVLGLKDFDIGFAGSHSESHTIFQHLEKMAFACSVSMEQEGVEVYLKHQGVTVAKFSGTAKKKWLDKTSAIKSVTVIAMVNWCIEYTEEQYRNRYKVENWEVPLVELVYCHGIL